MEGFVFLKNLSACIVPGAGSCQEGERAMRWASTRLYDVVIELFFVRSAGQDFHLFRTKQADLWI